VSVEGREVNVEGREVNVEGREVSVEGREVNVEGREVNVEGREVNVEGRGVNVAGREPLPHVRKLFDHASHEVNTDLVCGGYTERSLFASAIGSRTSRVRMML
jgi:hypothetical protein